MFKTIIMVNKREKNLLYNSDKQLSSFFISLILTLSFYYFLFFPYLFRFNFVVSERNVHIPFCQHIWAEISLLFWTFLSGTFFPGGECTCTQCTPPAYAPEIYTLDYCLFSQPVYKKVLFCLSTVYCSKICCSGKGIDKKIQKIKKRSARPHGIF